jgi:iron complex transport system substrate-binding protein
MRVAFQGRAIIPALAIGLLVVWLPAMAARQAAPSAPGSSALQVIDEMGRHVAVPQPVRRIVSLAPNLTETIFALGAGDRLVGDTDYCDYPPEAKTKPHVGGPVNPSLEEVVSLHPDLVLATRDINREATVQALEQLGIAVYATDPRSVEQVLTSTEQLSRVFGTGDAGQALAAQLRQRLADVQDRLATAKPKSVLFVVWENPLITVGQNTFLADALRLGGARSVIETSQDWPNISLEEVVRLQPEYLIFSSAHSADTQRDIAELRHRRGWAEIEALQRDRVIILTEAISRPSPRLVDDIEQLARALHPERFGAQPILGGRVF